MICPHCQTVLVNTPRAQRENVGRIDVGLGWVQLLSGQKLREFDEIWWGGAWRPIEIFWNGFQHVPNVIGVYYRRKMP